MRTFPRLNFRWLLPLTLLGIAVFVGGQNPVFAASSRIHPQVTCTWGTAGSTGTQTVYVYDPVTNQSYGYNLSAEIHTDRCGDAYATGSFTSNDTGSPGGYATVVLYRSDCNTGADTLSQQKPSRFNGGTGSLSLGPTVEDIGLPSCARAGVNFRNDSGNASPVKKGGLVDVAGNN